MQQHFPLGLDISDYKLRIIQLHKGFKNIAVTAYNEIDVPQGSIVNGLIKEVDQVAQLLKTLKNKARGGKIFKRRVIACLPEKQSFIKVIKPRELTEEEIKDTAKKHIPFDLEEVYFDWNILSRENKNVLIGACKKDIVDSYLQTISKAGLVTEVLENETEALARALLVKKDLQPSLIVDIGYARTTLLIHFNEVVQFTTSFNSVIENNTINNAQLEQYISKVTHFYQGQYREAGALKKIILCGSGAFSPEIVKQLGTQFKLDVQQGDPWINLSSKKNYKKITNPTAYTTAIGLALRSVNNRDYI